MHVLHPDCSAQQSRAAHGLYQFAWLAALAVDQLSDNPPKRTDSSERREFDTGSSVWYLLDSQTMCVHACCCEIEEQASWALRRCPLKSGSGRGPEQR